MLRERNRPLGMYTELLALTARSVLEVYTTSRADASRGRHQGAGGPRLTPCVHTSATSHAGKNTAVHMARLQMIIA